MSFRDCIISAREQGGLSPEEADDLLRRYERNRAAFGDGAKEKLEEELSAEAKRKLRLATLAREKQERIAQHLETFRNASGKADVFEAALKLIESFGFSGTDNLRGLQHAIVAMSHGRMAELIQTFERNFYTGLHTNKPLANDVVREMLGQDTAKPEAKAMARAVAEVFDDLLERFNKAGGDVARLERYIPQHHNPLALMKAGFEQWRDWIVPRLDRAKMRDPLTGGALSADRFEESLRAAFRNITTDGWEGRTPTQQRMGAGAIANQRQEHRFLQFRDADAWLEYDRQFGHGDPLVAIFSHVNSMARDIAAMEIFGPNPNAMIEWLKQVVQSEAGKAQLSQQSLFNAKAWTTQGTMDAGEKAAQRIEDVYQFVRGRRPVSQQLANTTGDVRNVLTSIMLGSTSLIAATTDPFIELSARRALGMPLKDLLGSNAKVFADTVSQFFAQLPAAKIVSRVIDGMTGAPREMAARSAMIADEFLHILGDEARYAGTLGGRTWSRWLADRTLTLTGLSPMTNARRAVFGLDMQAFMADLSGKTFPELPERWRIKMEGYGITAADWDVMRAVPHYTPDAGASGFLRPIDIARADERVAEKFLQMILGETERAVPSGTARSKSLIIGGGKKGTIATELVEGFTQFKAFGLSITTLQLEAMGRATQHFGKPGGAAHAAWLLPLATLGAAVGIQLRHLAQGRDPERIDTPKFWLSALAQGGGFGIFGDFLFAEWNRFGRTLGEQVAGPQVGLVSDLFKLTLGNVQNVLEGKGGRFANDAALFAGRYTPFLSSAWQTRLAYRRLVVNQLQWLLDPQAERKFRDEQRRFLRERGQGFWWAPGDTASSRLPQAPQPIPEKKKR